MLHMALQSVMFVNTDLGMTSCWIIVLDVSRDYSYEVIPEE